MTTIASDSRLYVPAALSEEPPQHPNPTSQLVCPFCTVHLHFLSSWLSCCLTSLTHDLSIYLTLLVMLNLPSCTFNCFTHQGLYRLSRHTYEVQTVAGIATSVPTDLPRPCSRTLPPACGHTGICHGPKATR